MLNLLQGPVQFSNHLFAGIDALARRRLMSILVVFFLSFGGSWLFSAFRGIPVPYIHDEFSYLLAGDTFAHGRITNPTHPMWEYFETFHVLQHPTYMSRYPPGQGIFLAVGQVIFGHPIYGVWLSAGLMCAAICWMLYAWVSPRWALIGGLVAVIQFGIFTYWSQSYWGGAVAGIGGALVFGALPRIIKYQRLRDALFLGLGIGILANTRPVEGILFGIPLGCIALPWKIKWQALDKRRLLKNAVLPLMLLILATAILTGIYNKKITGNALMLPHVLYSKLYSTIPVFIWQPLYPAVHYNHKVLADYFRNWDIGQYHYKRSWKGFTRGIFRDSVDIGMFFFGFPLAFPILLLFSYARTAARFILAAGIILLMLGMVTVPAHAHYAAPLTCMAVLLITIGLRFLSLLKLRRIKIGTTLVMFLVLLQLGLNLFLTPRLPKDISLATVKQISNGRVLAGEFSRQELKDILIKLGGNHLVIVKYPPHHESLWDWVYNDADIDNSPIVWARGMGGQRNTKLLEYYQDRQVWEIKVNWDYVRYYANEARL